MHPFLQPPRAGRLVPLIPFTFLFNYQETNKLWNFLIYAALLTSLASISPCFQCCSTLSNIAERLWRCRYSPTLSKRDPALLVPVTIVWLILNRGKGLTSEPNQRVLITNAGIVPPGGVVPGSKAPSKVVIHGSAMAWLQLFELKVATSGLFASRSLVTTVRVQARCGWPMACAECGRWTDRRRLGGAGTDGGAYDCAGLSSIELHGNTSGVW